MVGFVTIIPNLANDVLEILEKLKLNPKIYKINTAKNTRYNIRISKNVDLFLKTVNFKKD
jgi:hypothetical protein